MKIAIDGRAATLYSGTGIGTYTENLIKELLKIDTQNFYDIYWSGNNSDLVKNNNLKLLVTSKKHKKFFETTYFPYSLDKLNVDLYHIPQNGIGLNQNIHCKKIATVHDLIPYIMPETVGRGYLFKFLKEMPYIIENCDALITVSQFSKNDILRFFPIDPNKIFVTPLAANYRYKPYNRDRCKYMLKQRYNIDRPFVLYLGGFSNRKNLSSLIKAFSRVYKNLNKDYCLVIVGSYKAEGKPLLRLCDELNMSKHIIFAGYVEDRFLPVFYNACETFVYPSLYEGFGLPPLEAMSCGAPVITSNTTSIPEVVGDNAVLVNPLSTDEIEYALFKVLNNPELQNKLRKKSLERSKYFSWNKTAQLTINAYNKVINN